MKTRTKNQGNRKATSQCSLLKNFIEKSFLIIFLTFTLCFGIALKSNAIGSWSQVTTLATDTNAGEMILLSDGTVIAKARTGLGDGSGKIWNRLTPDANGSYANGTWTTITPMANTRLYFSSQVLKDGRVYVCGGEYGTGGSAGEVYNPVTNLWTNTPAPGSFVSDANSAILENGNVLQSLVNGSQTSTLIYNPGTNSFSNGPSTLGSYNESSWVKLPDNSILYVDKLSTNSERYIPASNTWIADATVSVSLYETLGAECGGALLLPDGRAFFIGGNSNTAFYTPSGNTTNGTWAAGPALPNSLAAPDAACTMMVNGRILLALSPTLTCCDGNGNNIFNSPTSFYEFNYLTNVYTQVGAPGGGMTLNIPTFVTNLLVLPNGQVLYGQQGSKRYFVYTPDLSPLAAGKPSITGLTKCGKYILTGTLFNGISEGTNYGDDWGNATNYPIVRLTNGANVYYCRTFNWNSTGVQRGSAADNVEFTLPAGLPMGPTYALQVIANGIASDPFMISDFSFNTPPTVSLQPASVSVQWGDNVSFTSTATSPLATTVQWQVSTNGGGLYTDIGGESGTTLNLSCITLSMNGYKYRAVFTNICGSTPSNGATLTVTPRTTTGTVTISPNPQQYSDTVNFQVTLSNAVKCGQQAATSVTIFVGTQNMGTIPLVINGSSLEATLASIPLLEPTPFGTAPTGNMSPGIHTVTAVFNGANTNFGVTDATAPLTINPEDARAYYTGACFAGTQSVNSYNAIVTLSATFKDITAVVGDPAWDPYAGDLRNATISFINRDNNTIIAANVPFGLVNPSDPTIAVATYNWNVTISGNSQTFTVGIIIGGYYTRNSSADNTILTVSLPAADFVTGGGYLVLSSAAGIKAGDVGSKNNFGFNAKYNRRGNTLQGNVNSIVRKTEIDGLHIYQIKCNNLTSISVQSSGTGTGKATINGRANIQDITNPLAPIGIDNDGSLQIKLTDSGQPGTYDSIAITIWNRNGGLWYASKWNTTRTIEQVLGGGNLSVNSNNSFRLEAIDAEKMLSSLTIFPNPNDGRFNIAFDAKENDSFNMHLLDVTGREVYFETMVATEGINNRNYDFTNLTGGLYLMILENNENYQMIKVIVQ